MVAPSQAAISFGSDTAVASVNSGTSWTPVNGDLCFMVATLRDTSDNARVTSVTGNNLTWVELVNEVQTTQTQIAQSIFVAKAGPSVSAGTVTVAYSGGSTIACQIIRFPNCSLPTPTDAGDLATASAITDDTTPTVNVTPSQSPSTILGVASHRSANFTNDGDYTAIELNTLFSTSGNAAQVSTMYKEESTDGSPIAVNGTLAFSIDWMISGVVFVEDAVDEDAPVISNLTHTDVTDTGFTVTWDTDEPADSTVEYEVFSSTVGRTAQFRFGSGVQVGRNLQSRADVFEVVGQEMPVRYSVTSPDITVGRTASFRSNIGVIVGRTGQFRSQVLEVVASPAAFTYDTLIIVGRTLQATANVYEVVGVTAQSRYDLAALVGREVEFGYMTNAIGIVGRSLSSRYSVAATVGRTAEIRYPTESLITVKLYPMMGSLRLAIILEPNEDYYPMQGSSKWDVS